MANDPRTLPNRSEMQRARTARDPSYDGIFWTGVWTTGIFCRPSCRARAPKEENVSYFGSVEAAQAAGLRACQRCLPLDVDGRPPSWIQGLLQRLDASPETRLSDHALRAAGFSPSRVRRWFLANHGCTFQAWQRARRVGSALAELAQGARVLDAGIAQGFESGSGFHAAVSRVTGRPPTAACAADRLARRELPSPVGPLVAVASDQGLCLLEFSDRRGLPRELARLERRFRTPPLPAPNPWLDLVERELTAYFEGRLRAFTVPVDVRGTPFQEKVWAELRRIPYGETISYGELARRVGVPGGARAVGAANGANGVPIVIPCHRVIQADGTLRGYGGGLWRKQRLLALEAQALRPQAPAG